MIFGFAFNDIGLCQYVNDYVAEAVKRYPDKLIGYMVLVPTASGVEREIDRCLAMGLKGIGEIFPIRSEI